VDRAFGGSANKNPCCRLIEKVELGEVDLVQGDFRIDDWLIQPQINSVEKAGKTWHLEPKVMQVLVHLASHPNEVLSKDRLLEAVWHNTFVGDDVLVRCISEIRYVFGDDPKSSRVIQTIPKGGYRLIATVTTDIQLDIEPSKPLTAKPETVFRYNLELDREKESQVAVVDEPYKLASWSPDSEAEQIAPAVVIDLPHRGPVPGVVQNGTPSNRHFWSIVGGASLIVLLSCLAATYAWMSTHTSAFDFFWEPVFSTNEPILICIADQNQYAAVALRDSADPTRQILLKDNLTAVVIDDLNAVIQVTGILKSNQRQYSLKGEGATTLTDLRNGPTVFVGAFDNAWTLRLTNPLRYHFANDPQMTQFRIVDRESPSQPTWGVDRLEQMATNNYRDYAIVARFVDGNTGKLALVIAGVGRGGTIAAGELVSNPTYLAQLSSAARASGNKKNMEIVLSTQIIDGQPGSPKIEATYFW
jgi:DNA-binding winged helix-turn-helix (wHTH) protein